MLDSLTEAAIYCDDRALMESRYGSEGAAEWDRVREPMESEEEEGESGVAGN